MSVCKLATFWSSANHETLDQGAPGESTTCSGSPADSGRSAADRVSVSCGPSWPWTISVAEEMVPLSGQSDSVDSEVPAEVVRRQGRWQTWRQKF